MAKQLIHTSAPRGLEPGSSGFCVVARHRDLRERLIPLLERASAYHHTNRPAASATAAPLNPVIYSHRIFSLGSDTYHILSRIVDAGNDYTRRSNYLAHHLILDNAEAAAAANANLTPADLLLAFSQQPTHFQQVLREPLTANPPQSQAGEPNGKAPHAFSPPPKKCPFSPSQNSHPPSPHKRGKRSPATPLSRRREMRKKREAAASPKAVSALVPRSALKVTHKFSVRQ
jgi:hypothetical protein